MAADSVAELYKFEPALDAFFASILGDAGLTGSPSIAKQRDGAALGLPRVELQCFAVQSQGRASKIHDGQRYHPLWQLQARFRVVTQRRDSAQAANHSTIVSEVRQVVQECPRLRTVSNLEFYNLKSTPTQDGYDEYRADGEDSTLDVTELTFTCQFEIREDAWPAVA